MEPTQEMHLELFTDYFQFYIEDEERPGDLGEDWTEEAVSMLLATTSGIVGVGTVRNMYAPVRVKLFGAEPPIDEWDEVSQLNECDLEITSGKAVIAGCTDYYPDAQRIELANGIYRVRIYYSNLDEISADGMDGEDSYELHLWLTNRKQPVKVLKHRSSHGQQHDNR